MKRILFSALIACSLAPAAKAQSFDYQFSTNGKQYALAYVRAIPEKLVRPDWKDVAWSFGGAIGSEVDGPAVLGAKLRLTVLDHNSHAYVSLDLAGLFPTGQKAIGVAGLSFGFAWPVKF